MAISFGVHIGRTSMCLAAEKDGRADVIANAAGDRVTPAMFGLLDGESLVGLSAKQLRSRKPGSVAFDTKGRIANSDNSNFIVDDEGRDKKVTVESIHIKFYKYMKEIAVSFATEEVSQNNTVITVPLDFTKKQRESIKKCAITAGFNVSQIISETAAATLAYGILPQESFKGLIFRCGGSSLTCSIISVNNGIMNVIKSLTKEVGGEEVTDLLIELLAQEFKRKNKADPRETKRGKMKLKINAENVKHVLSTLDNANCYIESLYEGIDFNANVSRSRFELEMSKVLPKFLEPINEVLSSANLETSDISRVILCGGTAKIPKLQKSLTNLFEKAEILSTINPDEVIAIGACIQASLLSNQGEESRSEFNESLSMQALNYDVVFVFPFDEKNQQSAETEVSILIPRLCPIPVRKSHHLPMVPGGSDIISVKVFLRSVNQELTEVCQLNLTGLENEDMKPSLSAHIHRDGSIHIALTEKMSNKCDQITLSAPSVSA